MLTSYSKNGELQIRLTKQEQEDQGNARIKQGRNPVEVKNWSTLVESVIGGFRKEEITEFKDLMLMAINNEKNGIK